jgi:hypothetical protein
MAAHDRPTASELIESVREWLEKDVLPSVDGRLVFHTRVAMNSLDIVKRELDSAEVVDSMHSDALKSLNVESDKDLSQRIQSGDFDEDLLGLLNLLAPVIENKVRVSNPKHLH